jgi:hypothetical protein
MRLELGKTAMNYFNVIDSNYNFVTGVTGFETTLIAPNETVYQDSLVTISELTGGRYKSEFTPTTTGNWYIEVRNETYFPYGKSDVIEVDTLDLKYDILLGLNHNNFVLDSIARNVDGNPVNARMRIYPDSGLTGTALAEWLAITTYDTQGNETSHKVKRVG